ncbi:MAG: ComF family protein [Defluviitaleaceae bacterium]|nr:ComF family protein [Defluviitaleaceae bacterium]
MKNLLENLIRLIYPNKCIVCEDIIKDDYQCEECKGYEYFKPSKFENASFIYDGVAKDTILRFKFNKKPFMAKGLAFYMYNSLDKNIFSEVDIITFVPIHKRKMRERGFNQAELLAKELGSLLKLPVKNILKRVIYTQPLKNISGPARENIMKNAISYNTKFSIKEKNILIIDDIYTTGTTISKCKEVLINAGAGNVTYATFCIVKKRI